jgi:hypothetical protein
MVHASGRTATFTGPYCTPTGAVMLNVPSDTFCCSVQTPPSNNMASPMKPATNSDGGDS